MNKKIIGALTLGTVLVGSFALHAFAQSNPESFLTAMVTTKTDKVDNEKDIMGNDIELQDDADISVTLHTQKEEMESEKGDTQKESDVDDESDGENNESD